METTLYSLKAWVLIFLWTQNREAGLSDDEIYLTIDNVLISGHVSMLLC